MASRRKPSVAALPSAARRPMWSTIGTRREAGAASRAQRGELRSGLGQKRLRRLGARRLQLGHAQRVRCVGRLVKVQTPSEQRRTAPATPPVASVTRSAYACGRHPHPQGRRGTGTRACRTTRAPSRADRRLYQSEIFKDGPKAPRQLQRQHRCRAGPRGLRRRGRAGAGAHDPPRPIWSPPARSRCSPRPTCWSSAAARPGRLRPSPPPASAPTCCWSSATITWAGSPPAASSSGSTA